ncbi:MAG TPA: NAD(P)/FAD-dependent oxidoreductase [Bacteroidales bacterium]|nr:NAD(P)/FAD-dependent oxidoreductase [Bacteroidales bacterium]HPS17078.1 NAD(P)/FAD-dependent oxidoreductase [Bacteroidales bacterium]
MNINVPSSALPRVVVIGGGFAGLSLIKHVDQNEFQVVLLDRNNYHTFQPLLYEVATSGLEVGSIAYPLRRYIKHFKNVFFRMAEVNKIDAEKKELCTSIGCIRYDYLVIATGSESNFFGNKLLEQKSMQMKNIPQALDIRSILLQNFEEATHIEDLEKRKAYMTFVIAGGGPTGVEMAGALAELKKHVLAKDYPELNISNMEIYLLEGSNRLLGVMSEQASKKAYDYLSRMGVEIWLNTFLKNFDGEKVYTNDGREINAKILLWSAGVKGATIQGLPGSTIIHGNRYHINSYNQIEGFENIFVAGDVAAFISNTTPKGHPMVASVAMQQGKLIAKNLLKLKRKEPLIEFKYFDKGSMATIGRNKAVADIGKIKFQGMLAWLIWLFIHLMAIIGFRNKVFTFFDWFWNYISYDRTLRLIIRPFKGKE